MSTYVHSGDAGDLIHSLPTIRALGGGTLFLARAEFTRVKCDQAMVDNIKPLLLATGYVKDVKLHHGQACKYDLDSWRYQASLYQNPFMPLQERYARSFGFGPEILTEPWLPKEKVFNCPSVILSRTLRRHNPRFPWPKIVERYAGKSAFIGFSDEYDDLLRGMENEIPFIPCPNIHYAAKYIGNAKLFIGNQGALEAIAEGLKMPKIVEVDLSSPLTMIQRPGAQYVCGDHLELPEV